MMGGDELHRPPVVALSEHCLPLMDSLFDIRTALIPYDYFDNMPLLQECGLSNGTTKYANF